MRSEYRGWKKWFAWGVREEKLKDMDGAAYHAHGTGKCDIAARHGSELNRIVPFFERLIDFKIGNHETARASARLRSVDLPSHWGAGLHRKFRWLVAVRSDTHGNLLRACFFRCADHSFLPDLRFKHFPETDICKSHAAPQIKNREEEDENSRKMKEEVRCSSFSCGGNETDAKERRQCAER